MGEKKRNSSLELLRIICMIMIILCHYVVNTDVVINIDTLNGNVIILQMISMFGRTACSIFAMISGYFLISEQNIGYKKIISLLAEMLFYSWLILIFSMITGVLPLSLRMIIELLFPMFWGNWYVIYYMILYLFVPFLNPFLRRLEKKNFLKMLLILAIIWSVIPTFTNSAWKFSSFDFFVVMYLVGGYIRLHADKPTYSNKINLWIALASGILMLLSVPVMDLIGVITEDSKYVNHACYFCEYNTLLSIILAVGIFLYFKQLQFYNPMVNRVGKSVVGIYLFHDNSVAREIIWKVISPNVDYVNSSGLFLHITLKCVLIFAIGFIVDQLRLLTVDRMFQKWIDRKYQIWQCKWKQIKKYIAFLCRI